MKRMFDKFAGYVENKVYDLFFYLSCVFRDQIPMYIVATKVLREESTAMAKYDAGIAYTYNVTPTTKQQELIDRLLLDAPTFQVDRVTINQIGNRQYFHYNVTTLNQEFAIEDCLDWDEAAIDSKNPIVIRLRKFEEEMHNAKEVENVTRDVEQV